MLGFKCLDFLLVICVTLLEVSNLTLVLLVLFLEHLVLQLVLLALLNQIIEKPTDLLNG